MTKAKGCYRKLDGNRKAILFPIDSVIPLLDDRLVNLRMANLPQIPVTDQPLILPTNAISRAIEPFTWRQTLRQSSDGGVVQFEKHRVDLAYDDVLAITLVNESGPAIMCERNIERLASEGRMTDAK